MEESSGLALWEQFPAVVEFALNVGYLAGIVLFGYGLYSFYARMGQNGKRIQQSSLSMVLAGLTLLSASFWANSMYSSATGEAKYEGTGFNQEYLNELNALDADATSKSLFKSVLPPNMVQNLIAFIYVVGLFAFLRGLYLIREVNSEGQEGNGAVGRVLSYVVGGLLCMSIVEFSCFLADLTNIDLICMESSS